MVHLWGLFVVILVDSGMYMEQEWMVLTVECIWNNIYIYKLCRLKLFVDL